MSGVPEEARCFADPEKECPLRAAVYAISQAHDDVPEGERMSAREYDASLEAATAALSKADIARFYAIIDIDRPTQDIRPGTCRTGAYRDVPFIGKMTCSAAAIHYVYKNDTR